MNRRRRRKRNKRKQYIVAVLVIGLIFYSVLNIILNDEESVEVDTVSVEDVPDVIPDTPVSINVKETVSMYLDEDNYIYPYNLMSADWGSDDVEDFNYFNIPKDYEINGGCLPEVVQVYTYCLSKDYGVDYPTVIALIERESSYKYSATGDGGASKGYMQVMEKWHKDRMERLGVVDLYNPYSNVRVGIDFLSEILQRYPDYNEALMVYNMGETGAKRLWNTGVYETEYSKEITKRSQEIKQEIQD